MVNANKLPVPYRFCFKLAEFMADTHHLGPFALGCLLRLMMVYWRHGPLKDDNRALAGVAGLQVKEWVGVRPELEPFFIVGMGQWIHEGVDQELDAAYAAMKVKRDQTHAAREALKKKREAAKRERAALEHEQERLKRELEAVKAANNARISGFDNLCHSDCHKTPTTTKEEPQAPQARESWFLPSGFADDVLAAEHSLGINGGTE